MSKDITDEPLSPNDNNPRPKYLYSAGVFRTTYTVNNAAKFLIFFRTATSRLADTFIRGDLLGGRSPKTWVQKANDALLFLCNESLKEWEELNPRTIETNDFWIRFRMSVKFKPVIDPDLGLWILFKSPVFSNAIKNGTINNILTVKPAALALTPEQIAAEINRDNTQVTSPAEIKREAVINTGRAEWEQRVIDFIEGVNNDKTLVINNLSLSPNEIIWVHDRIGELQIDKVVRTDTIRLLRR